MEQYISKSAAIAEIERRIFEDYNSGDEEMEEVDEAVQGALASLRYFIDTLEVKEVGLDLGSPYGDMGVKTVWDEDKIVSSKVQEGGES